MLNKIWEKTNPSGFRNPLSRLHSRLKPATAKSEAVTQETSSGPAEKNTVLLMINNKVRQEVTHHLGEKNAPDFIRNFLHAQWSRLMLKIYLKRGPKSDAWKHSVQVIDDLVKITDSRNINEIEHHQKDMQFLLHRLNKGMSIIPLPPTARNQFLSQLMAYDRALVKKFNELEPPPSPPASRNPGALFAEELLVDNKKNSNPGFTLDND